MVEKEIEVFIECIENYFSKRSDEKIIIEAPFLTKSLKKTLSDYTGIISISGAYKGNIYFTAPQDFVKRLIVAHGQDDFSDDLMQDTVGEVTNTLSGNARRDLGSDFVISVPNVMYGKLQPIELTRGARSYVVPLTWHNCHAAMVVSVYKV